MSPGNCDQGERANEKSLQNTDPMVPSVPGILSPCPCSFPQGCFREGRRGMPSRKAVSCRVNPTPGWSISTPVLKQPYAGWKEQPQGQTGGKWAALVFTGYGAGIYKISSSNLGGSLLKCSFLILFSLKLPQTF